MASITIRNLDDGVKERLRLRAAQNHRSMEEEVRSILSTVLSEALTSSGSLADSIRSRFEPLGGVELLIPVREPMRVPPSLE